MNFNTASVIIFGMLFALIAWAFYWAAQIDIAQAGC